MSFLSGGRPAAQQQSSLFELEFPRSLAVYDSYAEAQQAVDFLSDKKFEVKNLCIVGTDLRSVERVLGRRNWATVIGNGALSGVSTGLLIGLIMLLFFPSGTNPLALLLVAILLAVVLSIVFQSITYAMSGGRRDFTSVTQTVATRYEVLCEHKQVSAARTLLDEMPGARAAAFVPPSGSAGSASEPRPVEQQASSQPYGREEIAQQGGGPQQYGEPQQPAPYQQSAPPQQPAGDPYASQQGHAPTPPQQQQDWSRLPDQQQDWSRPAAQPEAQPDRPASLTPADQPDRRVERSPWPAHSPVTPPAQDRPSS